MKIDEYFDKMLPSKNKSCKKVSKETREIDKLSEIEICDEIIKNNFKISKHKKVDEEEIINYRSELMKDVRRKQNN